MAICGSYIFDFRVTKDIKKIKNKKTIIKRRISMYLLVLCLTLIVKELKISVE